MAGSAPTIRGCIFSGNVAGIAGGAVYCSGASPHVESCIFEGNSATVEGGAFYGINNESIFTDCHFHDNAAETYGGAISVGHAAIVMQGCTLSGNEAPRGGALNFSSCSEASEILVSTFTANHASGYGGGVAYLYASYASFAGCALEENTSDDRGGGVYASHYSMLLCEATEFARNAAVMWGGGIYFENGDTREQTIDHCTFYANDAPEAICRAGGGPHQMRLINTVIYHPIIDQAVTNDGSLWIECCDICDEALSGVWPFGLEYHLGIHGNIAADPRFCNPANWDLTLHCESPCATDPECGLMGAWPVGCGSSPVESASWGKIKAVYR